MKKRMALTAIGLGAAYLMRNKDARDKLSRQFDEFNDTPMRGERKGNTQKPEPNKGLLGRFLD
ncbi:hypothetical protein CSV75_14345 [Sporosarcina sp. P18a]|uniref:hypothetical protein n=1 Tax=unclassified Sporosarcina TaxID=2647733 RepID=UPI000C16D506|nr:MULTISPECIES: hypothetical protein [unclassified Sporosarcina]PIC70139.1 hypothetical protein CSV77_10290 [Sporosarcina sp. P16b]PIC78892.1 hypothetical protein CSV75_14345 [Sporosarcina sp. P18a]PID01947.1 hypothetical protein CSV67_11405 [Sporosarcina sp. P2]PID24315.1 hypothetical protein CSV60_10135 [Sporosarcina sp. P7]